MSASELIEGIGVLFTVLACTWHLSSKITSIQNTASAVKEKLAEHMSHDDHRFDELFRSLNSRRRDIREAPKT